MVEEEVVDARRKNLEFGIVRMFYSDEERLFEEDGHIAIAGKSPQPRCSSLDSPVGPLF